MDDKTASAATEGSISDDQRYYYDSEQLQRLKTESPWMKDPKFFSSIAISPTAVMKIMKHCQSGVAKGIQKGGNPIEVMGMLLGRPDTLTPHTLVVTDAFPLPIEGFETRVIADDENVVNHMITLGESLEITRKERFMGWYHSHPFDLGKNSHCFLSQTDLSTQLQWQRAEDPHGNPFVAIVVDPIRSYHYSIPEIKAFRAYPPEYNSPVEHECPDGTIETADQQRLELWGSCWSRYYELKVEYFCSQISRNLLDNLTSDYIWMRTLQNQSEASLVDPLCTSCTKQFSTVMSRPSAGTSNNMDINTTGSSSSMARRSTSGGSGGGRIIPRSANTTTTSMDQKLPKPLEDNKMRTDELNDAIHQLKDIAAEQLAESTLLETKKSIFS